MKSIPTQIKRVKNKSNEQKSAIYSNIALNNAPNNVIKLFDYYSSITSEAKYKTIHEEGIKILAPKQMFKKLPNWFWQFLCERLCSFNPKGFWYLYVCSRSLCEGRTSFGMGLISRKLCRLLHMFLTGFTSLLFPLSVTVCIFVYSFLFYFI